jgi:hypothetical protein
MVGTTNQDVEIRSALDGNPRDDIRQDIDRVPVESGDKNRLTEKCSAERASVIDRAVPRKSSR